jgi:protein-disulfide isomerase
MSARGWIIFGAICVVLFGGLIFWSGRDRVDVSSVNTNKILAGSAASGNIGDHVFGNKNAKVMLVEYGDFQCPGCGSAYPIVKALSEKYKDHLAFVFRNFPLTSIHPNARAAAAAAETAGQMGKYWEMHNILYENQNEWSETSTDNRTGFFAGYAERVGLNKNAFTTKLNNTTNVSKKINFDMALGRKLNINGTPTFYLDGKKLVESQYNGQEAFEKTLLAEFKHQGVTIPTKS